MKSPRAEAFSQAPEMRLIRSSRGSSHHVGINQLRSSAAYVVAQYQSIW